MSEQDTAVPWNVREVRPTGQMVAEVALPVEIPLVIELNGRPVVTLMALPGMERELAIGFCLSEGLVAAFPDILLVRYCRDEPEIDAAGQVGTVVRVQARPEAVRQEGLGWRMVFSGCGGGDLDLQALELGPLPAAEKPLLVVAALWAMGKAMRRGQGLYRSAGGVHGAGLFAPDGRLLIVAEDIGRHNAVDKVLGAAVMRGLSLEDKVLLSTGRASHELVSKALRLRVPLVGSLSIATSLAVQLAEEGHCTLVGRLRGERFQVYTHPGRIA